MFLKHSQQTNETGTRILKKYEITTEDGTPKIKAIFVDASMKEHHIVYSNLEVDKIFKMVSDWHKKQTAKNLKELKDCIRDSSSHKAIYSYSHRK